MNDSRAQQRLGRFLTIADAAEQLNVSANQVYQLVRSGELPAIKVGTSGQWRIETAMLEAYIDTQYEEVRRHNLWNQAEFANVIEFDGPGRTD